MPVAAPASPVYDRNLHRNSNEVSRSSLAFVFMEAVRWHFHRASTLPQVERALNSMGYPVGCRLIHLHSLRSHFRNSISSSGKSNTATRLLSNTDVLHFITTVIWPALFGKEADSLEKSMDDTLNNFMITDNDPLFTKYIAQVPKEYASLNCEAFLAGIIEGILDSCYFKCEVSPHAVPSQASPNKTVFLIKFITS